MNNFEHAARLTELTDMGAHELALKVIELEEREAALRAYVDRLSRAVEACMSNDSRAFVFTSDDYRELESALDSKFSDALARRDLIKQAEALEEVGHDEEAYKVDKPLLLRKATYLRQQVSAL